MFQSIGGFGCPVAKYMGNCNDEKEKENGLAFIFREAVDEHKDKVLRGLNHMCDEEMREKILEFIAKFHPGEDATPEALLDFEQRLVDFVIALEEMNAQSKSEMLINFGDEDDFMGFMQSRINSNPMLKQQLQN
jgi:hypothetical protein